MSLQAMRAKRSGLIAEMRGMLDVAKKEADRDLNETEQAAYDAKMAELNALTKRIEREEALSGHESSLSNVTTAVSRSESVIHRAGAPEAKREFESLGEFLNAVRFNKNDQRLVFDENVGKQAATEQRMDTGSTGGFAVPSQFRDTLMKVDPQSSVIRPRATVLEAGNPPDSDVTIPALDQSGSAPDNMYGGVKVTWTGEGGTVERTKANIREITLKPDEMSGSIPITDKLLRNWSAAQAFLSQQLRGAVNAAEDVAFLKGNGVAKPLGIINSGAAKVVNRAVSNQISYNDLVQMKRYLLGTAGIWMVSKGAVSQLEKMEDTEGHLIWKESAREGEPATLLGKPVIENTRNPALGVKGDISLVDASKYLIKDGSGPFISMSEHVLFEESKTLVKIIWNVAGQPWLTAPIQQENGETVSPFVVLDVP